MNKHLQVLENYLDEVEQLVHSFEGEEYVEKTIVEFIEETKALFPSVLQKWEAFFQGEQAFYQGKGEDALAYYEKAVDVPNQEFFLKRAKGLCIWKKGDQKSALKFIDQALKVKPDEVYTLRMKQHVLEAMGNTDFAISLEEKISSIKAKNPQSSVETYLSAKLGINQLSVSAIESALQEEAAWKKQVQSSYLAAFQKSFDPRLAMLRFLEGEEASCPLTPRMIADQGGYVLSWEGKEIIVNPKAGFLRRFHQSGGYVPAITACVVTSVDSMHAQEIIALHELNQELNDARGECHRIKYYLEESAFHQLAPKLKGKYKEENNLVHPLSLYMDSNGIEEIEISSKIKMRYFSTGNHSIGLQWMLGDDALKVGYLGRCVWSEKLIPGFLGSDVLILGVGETDSSDYGKLSYHPSTLGYYGALMLLSHIKPQFAFLSELLPSGKLKLEFTQALRKEQEMDTKTLVFPTEVGLKFDLRELEFSGSPTSEKIPVDDVLITLSTTSPKTLIFQSKRGSL